MQPQAPRNHSLKDRQEEIREAVLRHKGNRRAAARELGISDSSVRKYLRNLAAEPPHACDFEAAGEEAGGDIPALSPLLDLRAWAKRFLGGRKGAAKASSAIGGPCAEALPFHGSRPESLLPVGATPSLVIAPHPYRRVAFVSDVHFGTEDEAAVECCEAFLRDYRPDLVILGGDLFDFDLISDHEHDPLSRTLQYEIDRSHDFFKAINRLGADVVYLLGNHEYRLQKFINRNAAFEGLEALDFSSLVGLPPEWQVYPSQTHFRVGSLLFLHGDLRGRGGSQEHVGAGMLRKLRTSCMVGHWHRFSAHYERAYDGTVRAGFGNGHLQDISKIRYITSPAWTSGFSTIDFAYDRTEEDEMTGGGSIFSVAQRVIVGGRLVANGKIYGKNFTPRYRIH